MAKEGKVSQDIVLELQKHDVRLFRNNIGKLQDRRGQWVAYGVGGNGGSDNIGFTVIEVTPEMVGSKVAVFTAIEVKRDEKEYKKWSNQSDQRSRSQAAFLSGVSSFGGIAFCAYSVSNAISSLKDQLLFLRNKK